ncbi:MAG TPA: hypothetical protein DHW07_06065 [Gammaproteobacteria bacterium]|nr:hypothetical protein [Gammaproteobacteria bacterium]|tara:strand:- start:835 stop:2004 length:1170 start_codon:yes stop_codon:yes gene_type:complete
MLCAATLGSPVCADLSQQFELSFQGQFFPSLSLDSNDIQEQFFAGVEAEFISDFESDYLIGTFLPYGRIASAGGDMNHVDIRELNLLYTQDKWEGIVGISRVFWGVTESGHLVDIINQTDQLEGFDGEDKLGQTMIRISRLFDQNTVDLYVLPGFREREFLLSDQPLALPFPVSNDKPLYGADNEAQHVDFALRLSGYQGMADYGLSWFSGTSRDPEFIIQPSGAYRPRYPLIHQVGLDLQLTLDSWLWKLEAIHRTFESDTITDDFTAVIGGTEYTIYGLAAALFDLGLLAEWHGDNREDHTTVPMQNDLFTGMRASFSDTQSSEFLAGIFSDLDDGSNSVRVEASRRILDDARITLEAQSFVNVDSRNALSYLKSSDFVLLSLQLFF